MRVADSPDFLQSVIDHPKVKRWVAPDGVDDLPLSLVFEDGVGLEFDTGGFFFHRLGEGIYEVHTLFLPGSSGVLDACKAAAHYMFCTTDCSRIITKVPEDNIAAWKLTEKMCFCLIRTVPVAFLRNGILHDVRHYRLDMDDWAYGRAKWAKAQCDEMGQPEKGARLIYRHAVFNDNTSLLEN